ncbi:MAG: amidohydrolase, partial [Clostridia bacterium]
MRLVFRNGVVYTMNRERPVADGFIVEDGIIVSLDTPQSADERMIDLRGRTVLPGLIDSHTHFVSYCCDVLTGVDISGCDSAREAAEAVGEALHDGLADRAKGWVVGGGWDKNRWPGDEFPDKDVLDAVVGDRPVALYSRDCHAVWLNTVALEEVGVTQGSQDPPGGEIRREADGRPNGILLDSAMEPVRQAVPPPSEDQLLEAVRGGIRLANSLGITGIVSCEGRDAFRVLSRLAAEAAPALRTWATIPEGSLAAIEQIGLGGGVGNPYFGVVGLKIMLDGSLGSQTAYLEEPYQEADDETYRGLLLKDGAQLGDLVQRAAALGLPSFIHAIGDAACELAISTLERYGNEITGHRIEHAQLLKDDHPGRMAEIGVIASVQPAHLGDDVPLVQRHWGKRSSRAYALRDLAKAGVVLAFGSDVPVAP